jgi:predicted alternative tryptophan synthase beta-subunit
LFKQHAIYHYLEQLTYYFFVQGQKIEVDLYMLYLVFVSAAFKRVSQLEGIIPALETSHALAYLEKLCPTLPNGTKVVVNCSGRGDKDVQTAIKYLKI